MAILTYQDRCVQIWGLIGDWMGTLPAPPGPATPIPTNPLQQKLSPTDVILSQMTRVSQIQNLITNPSIAPIWGLIPWTQLRNNLSTSNPNLTWEQYLLKVGPKFGSMTYKDVKMLRDWLPEAEKALPSYKSEIKLLGVHVTSVDLVTCF